MMLAYCTVERATSGTNGAVKSSREFWRDLILQARFEAPNGDRPRSLAACGAGVRARSQTV